MEKFLIRYKLIRKFYLLLILNDLLSFCKTVISIQSKKLTFLMTQLVIDSFLKRLTVISELINADFVVLNLKRFILNFLFINLSSYKKMNI